MTTKPAVFALLLVMCSAILASCGASNAEILSEGRTVEVSLMRHLPTGMVSWIDAQAAELAAGRTTEDGVRQEALQHVTGDDPEGRGPDVLTFFVTMAAVRNLDKKSIDDQKQAEAIVRATTVIDAMGAMVDNDLSKNSPKDDSDPCTCGKYEQSLDGLAAALQQSKTWMTITVREPADVGDLKALKSDLDHMKDTMDELSKLQALRMRAYADRRSALIQVLSTLLKKASDTSSTIIQNMK